MNAILLLASVVHCYVGCNSGSPDKQALHVLECDAETGAAKIVQSVKGVQGTTYFQFDADGRHLYSVIGERRGAKSVGSVVRFSMDGWKVGEMERLAELPCEAPCHVALTPDGKRIAFAAYCSATVGTVGIDGGDLRTFVFPDDAMGPSKVRQQKSFAHQAFCLPDGRLGFVDLGCDRLWFFDPVTMKRDASLSVRADPGDGPRHALVSKDGRFLFVLNELGNSVASYALPGLVRVGRWSTLPASTAGEPVPPPMKGEESFSKAAAIKLTADGRILMASNRGHDSIAFYDVKGDGTLVLKNVAKLTGRFPRDFELMPGEKFMIVGHKMSDEIQVYRFDRAACTLTPVGDPVAVWRPLCFKFLEEVADGQDSHR